MQNSEKNLRPGIRKRGKKGVRFHEQKLLKTKPRRISSRALCCQLVRRLRSYQSAGLCEEI